MKIIINNKSKCDKVTALNAVLEVVRFGKMLTGGRYCYPVTGFNSQMIIVHPHANKKSDRFTIHDLRA